MTHSSAPNTPNIPPPPTPPTGDPSRNRDEWIAVLVALLTMGGIFFWVFGTERPNASLLGRRSSSSTQVKDLPRLSELLQEPLALDSYLSSQPLDNTLSASESETTRLQPRRSSNIARGTGLVLGGGSFFGGRQTAPTTAEEVPVEGETPLEATDTETPVEGEALETSPEAIQEGTTEDPAVVPTDETETPETEAEQSQNTEEPAETTAKQAKEPRFGIPILGLGNNSDETETPAATEEDPTEATATAPEEEEDPTEATATAPEEGEDTATAEQAAGEETPTATAAEEEQATAAKPDKPSLGFAIPGFGTKEKTPTDEQAEFSDVPDDFWAKDYVQYFVQRDLITGYEDGTFKPEEPMSRAAVASQIEDAFGFAEEEREQALNFDDVSQEFWAEPAIDATTKTGFLAGYPGDVFRPEQPMTRTEVLVAIVSGLDLKPSGDPQEILAVYQDAEQIPAWAVEKVAAATEAGLVANYPNMDTFNPNEPATRAEVSAMLYQALVQAGKADPMSSEYIINPKK